MSAPFTTNFDSDNIDLCYSKISISTLFFIILKHKAQLHDCNENIPKVINNYTMKTLIIMSSTKLAPESLKQAATLTLTTQLKN